MLKTEKIKESTLPPFTGNVDLVCPSGHMATTFSLVVLRSAQNPTHVDIVVPAEGFSSKAVQFHPYTAT